jgi:transposase-like protein
MLGYPYCSSSDVARDGHNPRGRAVHCCRACGRHATSESTSLVAGHRFPRDIILLAVRYYRQLGAAAERIAGILADRGVDVSGRTILRWVQKFAPALSEETRRYRTPVSTTWLVDETYVNILGNWHYLYRGVDENGEVLDCWLSRTRDLAASEAFFRRTMNSTGCMPEHVDTEKPPSILRSSAPTHRPPSRPPLASTTGRSRPIAVSGTHGYAKSRVRRMRGLKSFRCATRLFPPWTRSSWSSATSYECRRSERRAPVAAATCVPAASRPSSLAWAGPCRTQRTQRGRGPDALVPPDPTPMSENRSKSSVVSVVTIAPAAHACAHIETTRNGDAPRPRFSMTSSG